MGIFEKFIPFNKESKIRRGQDDVPERVAERNFSNEKPNQEILKESSAEEICAEVQRRIDDPKSINPISFFKYRDINLKIGILRNLGKMHYGIQFEGESEEENETSAGNIENKIHEILKEIDNRIDNKI